MAVPKAKRLLRSELIRMLSETLGQEKAEEAVTGMARKLEIFGLEYDRAQALAILEHLANGPDIVGVVARFAKARVILHLKPDEPPPSGRGGAPDSAPASSRSTPPPRSDPSKKS